MNHLTTGEIVGFVDEMLLNGEKTKLMAHLEECARCQREVAFQRNLRRIVQQQPLVRPSSQFTERVMGQILPRHGETWAHKILNNLGSVFAMMLVLGILGYALTSTSSVKSGADQSQLSQVTKTFSDLLNTTNQAFVENTNKVSQKVIGVRKPDQEKLFTFIVLSLLVLAGIDKYVFRHFLRMKH